MKSAGISALIMAALLIQPVYAQDENAGSNPIIRNVFTADPAALVVGERVYLYVGRDASHDDKYRMPDWRVYSSGDMKDWHDHGTVFAPTDFKWSTGDAYASQVVEKDGKFYFFATAKYRGDENNRASMAIGVAVSDNPTGPFTDARGTPLITNHMTPQGQHGWSDIDPTVFTDDDGTSWLMWGNGNCFMVRLTPDMTGLDGPIEEIDLPFYEEGPWLHKRDQTYYLTYASWDHEAHKAERISYATAPSIRGPWTYQGELTGEAENSSTIHASIIEFRNNWYFFYHDGGWTIGDQKGSGSRRAVRAEHLYYNADGTLRPVIQTRAGVSAPRQP